MDTKNNYPICQSCNGSGIYINTGVGPDCHSCVYCESTGMSIDKIKHLEPPKQRLYVWVTPVGDGTIVMPVDDLPEFLKSYESQEYAYEISVDYLTDEEFEALPEGKGL